MLENVLDLFDQPANGLVWQFNVGSDLLLLRIIELVQDHIERKLLLIVVPRHGPFLCVLSVDLDQRILFIDCQFVTPNLFEGVVLLHGFWKAL